MIELEWWQFAFLCWMAFVGLWHTIGIPPVKDWFKKNQEENAD